MIFEPNAYRSRGLRRFGFAFAAADSFADFLGATGGLELKLR